LVRKQFPCTHRENLKGLGVGGLPRV